MSGIYIPSGEMPKEKGPHKIEIRLYVRADGTAGLWGIEKYIPHEPLDVIPVHDHGRLIDADLLVKVLKRCSEDEWNIETVPFSWSYAYECVMDIVEDMPTVIEAEGEP